jgi:hypothetical protein
MPRFFESRGLSPDHIGLLFGPTTEREHCSAARNAWEVEGALARRAHLRPRSDGCHADRGIAPLELFTIATAPSCAPKEDKVMVRSILALVAVLSAASTGFAGDLVTPPVFVGAGTNVACRLTNITSALIPANSSSSGSAGQCWRTVRP